MSTHRICTVVNNTVIEDSVEARLSLVDYLRYQCRLVGTHVGCEHGVCGACTVLVDGVPVKSCLMLAVQADGSQVRTVESLSEDGCLHPLQELLSESHGLQCGFCTPGFLMAALGLAESSTEFDEDGLREEISGNLCRCTGYQGIMAAIGAYLQRERSERRA